MSEIDIKKCLSLVSGCSECLEIVDNEVMGSQSTGRSLDARVYTHHMITAKRLLEELTTLINQ
jgi:hypothetical protein